jgi:hypothetical protein
MTVLDAPRVDTIILDETILDDVAGCDFCTEPAAYLARMRCCTKQALVGDTCVSQARSRPVPPLVQCVYCKTALMPTVYDDLVEVIPI